MRETCPECSRPVRACYCYLVQEVSNRVPLVIWQHPSEVGHAKGSGPLLARCLTQARLVVGEQLSPQQLGVTPSTCWLVYPGGDGQCSDSTAVKPAQLLVLDATWRKSRKMLHLNPWLEQLKRLSLSGIDGRYRIRRAERAGQLSSLEAAAYALGEVESETATRSLLGVFDQFNEHFARFVPTGHPR